MTDLSMHTTIHQTCAAEGCCVFSQGTLSPSSILPKLLAALATLSPVAHQQLTIPGTSFASIPQDALDDGAHDWWSTRESEAAVLTLVEAVNEHAPAGFVLEFDAGEVDPALGDDAVDRCWRLGLFPVPGV